MNRASPWLPLSGVLAAAYLGLMPILAGSTAAPSWEHWRTIAGVFDMGGPRSDGSLVVAGSASLYLVDPAGNVTPYARGPGGYHDDPGTEAYLAVSHGLHVSAAACAFARDDVFVLRLHAPLGITQVEASGQATRSLANVPGVTSLSGIALDTTGAFGNRLLTSGASGGKTVISAIDCNGGVQVITRSAPVLEGGLAVAPAGFGSFGGELIAPDEYGGNIYAIAANGAVTVVVKPRLRTGTDTGVESLGFVPTGFMGGGEVYYADRATANNPHPGTDTVLRLAASQLAPAGVHEGDLLVATEGGAALVAVHCGASCSVITVIGTPTTAHGEGHIVFTIGRSASTSSPSTGPSTKPSPAPVAGTNQWFLPATAIGVILGLVAAVAALAIRRRRR